MAAIKSILVQNPDHKINVNACAAEEPLKNSQLKWMTLVSLWISVGSSELSE